MPLDEVAQLLHADIILTEALAKHHGLNVVKRVEGNLAHQVTNGNFS